MKHQRAVILLGPFSDDPAESVSAVNQAFVVGLTDAHTFVCHAANRQYGAPRQASFNAVNVFYFIKHLALWFADLVRRRPDIAHYAITSGWGMEKALIFLKLARICGAKTLGHLHGGGFIDHWKTIPQWRRKFAFRELKRLDGLVVLSEGWRKVVAENIGLRLEKLFVVNNPINREFEEAALQMSLDRSDNLVLSLGVMEQKKGVLDLLEAAAIARQRASFTLKLVGPEREPDILRKVRQSIAAHSLADMVDLQSGVWGQEKIELFRRAAILVLPSYFENFPLVVLEAAAAGMAIITTPLGAIPEFFNDKVTALFVEPGNTEQLAEAILKLVTRPKERQQLGQAARAVFCHRLARSRIMASLDGVYQRVLAAHVDEDGPSPAMNKPVDASMIG